MTRAEQQAAYDKQVFERSFCGCKSRLAFRQHHIVFSRVAFEY